MKRDGSTRRHFLRTTAAATLSATLGQTAVDWPKAVELKSGGRAAPTKQTPRSVLSLRQPASDWIEGLPIANGISAAMVWGLPARVILSLNHVDFWRDNLGKEIDDYSKYVREAQRLMLEGKAKEANSVYYQKVDMVVMPRQKHSYPTRISGYTNSFQPVGNVIIELRNQLVAVEYRRALELQNRALPQEQMAEMWVTEYRRTLDLQNGIATITYKNLGKGMRQEYFIPAKHDAIVVRITSEEAMSGHISFDRPAQAPVPEEYRWSATAEGDALIVEGSFVEGVKSAVVAMARILAGKGEIMVDTHEPSLRLAGVTDVLLLIAIDAGKGQHNPVDICRSKMAALSGRRYEETHREHCEEHSRMFDRVELVLGKTSSDSPDDTSALVCRGGMGKYDNALEPSGSSRWGVT